MSPTPPRIRRTIPPEQALPRFELPSERVLDESEVLATAERKTQPSFSAMRPYRPVTPVPPRADSTADVAVEDILLEAWIEPPPPKRQPTPPTPKVAVPTFVPQRRSEQAEVDALLERHHERPLEVEVPSIAPVALATAGAATVFPPPVRIPIPYPQLPSERAKHPSAAVVIAVAIGLLVVGGGAAALVARPAWVARAKDIASGLVARASRTKTSTPVAAARSATAVAAVPAPPPTTVVAPPPPAPSATVEAPPQPMIDSSSTLVRLPPYAKGHRIFFDGVVIGDATPASPVTMRCGGHVIRLGTTGRVRRMNLPCGGAITLR